ARALHPRDQLFHEAQFRWIDEVVRRVYGQHWHRDARELATGVVIARGVHLVQEVVRVGLGGARVQPASDERIGRVAPRGRALLHGAWLGGNRARRPPRGWGERPSLLLWGRMRKWVVVSSGGAPPNSSPANKGERNCLPAPPVPCRIRTALRTTRAASRRGW